MSIIFSDQIKSISGMPAQRQVETIYDYLKYMTEQIEFWAKNRTNDITKINTAIATMSEDTEQKARTVTDLGEIQPGESGSYTIPDGTRGILMTCGERFGEGLMSINSLVSTISSYGYISINTYAAGAELQFDTAPGLITIINNSQTEVLLPYYIGSNAKDILKIEE